MASHCPRSLFPCYDLYDDSALYHLLFIHWVNIVHISSYIQLHTHLVTRLIAFDVHLACTHSFILYPLSPFLFLASRSSYLLVYPCDSSLSPTSHLALDVRL